MKILLNENGNVVGYGIDSLWIGNSNAYTRPAFIPGNDLAFLWKWDTQNNINDQGSWEQISPADPSLSNIIQAGIVFGLEVRAIIIELLRGLPLTDNEKLQLLDYISPALSTLDWGDIEVSRYKFNQLNTNSLYTTNRKNAVLAMLDDYLN